jgi:hypothetical protein
MQKENKSVLSKKEILMQVLQYKKEKQKHAESIFH